MKRFLICGTAVLALAACNKTGGNTSASASTAPIAKVAAPAGTDWTTTVTRTADGGFRMGNPDAKVKLVEYGSLSCSHCADFSRDGMEPLKANFISTGQVSYEFRSYLLQGPDVMATMLVQCGGPQPFFGMLEQMYANQADWLGKLVGMAPAEQQRLNAMPPVQQFSALAETTGLVDFVEARGVGRDAAAKCLANPQTPDQLLKMRDRANTEFQLQGTPTFIINGETVPETGNWAGLEPKLRAALS